MTLLVPISTVIGLSVSSLNVKHFLLRKVVSSCNPPESVKHNVELLTKPKNLI